jgi:hypothetical protein
MSVLRFTFVFSGGRLLETLGVMGHKPKILSAMAASLMFLGCSGPKSIGTASLGHSVVIHYHEGWLGRPVIAGSINGVRGEFLIDTGANEPILTMKAIRECRIPLAEGTRSEAFIGDAGPKHFGIVKGDVKIEVEGATIQIANASVVSGLGSDKWFGLIDYHTLRACHAIINVAEKSLTLSP